MIQFFSVYDQAAHRYLDPFPAPTTEFAIRGFRQTCQNPEHGFAKFPEDYVLFRVGGFDPETGLMAGESAPVKIASALDFVQAPSTLKAVNDG